MPIVDMPLEELRKYTGRNPRPADFDRYWEEGLAEMRAVDPHLELKPSDDFCAKGADCCDLRFTGVGGSRVYAKLLKPKGAKNTPAVLLFHGYTGSSGEWAGKLSYVAEGFTVVAMDCRGQGGLSDDTVPVHGTTYSGHIVRGLSDPDPRALAFRRVYLDCAQLAYITMGLDFVDPTRIACTGGSQGGGLSIACASLVPEIKKAAPMIPFLCDYKRVWEMDLDQGAYAELRAWFRAFDPAHKREDAVFERLGYIDNVHLADRIKADVLMGVGLLDTICPPSTQFAAYNRMTCKKDMLVLPDFAHEMTGEFSDATFMFIEQML